MKKREMKTLDDEIVEYKKGIENSIKWMGWTIRGAIIILALMLICATIYFIFDKNTKKTMFDWETEKGYANQILEIQKSLQRESAAVVECLERHLYNDTARENGLPHEVALECHIDAISSLAAEARALCDKIEEERNGERKCGR